MHQPQPNKLHDELDALLDGRPVELTDELAPLVEAADALRVELAAYQLDPAVADRHLERVLGGSALVVPMPTRPRSQPSGWDLRRRVVAVALAAALVLAPATMASAASLPGQAMYPFKLAIEQLRLASVQWSPSREAGERTRVAHERLREVRKLYQLQMYPQLPTAIRALNRAVVAAQMAVAEAQQRGESVLGVAAKLNLVRQAGGRMVQVVGAAAENGSVPLLAGTRDAIKAAVQQSQQVLPPPPAAATTPPKGGGGGTGTLTQTTLPTAPTQGPGTSASTSPSSQSTATTSAPEPSTSQATTTTTPSPPTDPPTTLPPPPDVTATGGSIGGDAGGTADQAGSDGQASHGYAPTSTTPPTTTP